MNRKIVRREFGILKSVRGGTSFSDDVWDLHDLTVTNEDGQNLVMVGDKWYRQIPAVRQKALGLIGKKVHIHTSQTTANWSDVHYFCDIDELRVDNV